ncbi:hypothetical protein BDM02DRAFT_3113063 [Thelephora ganbajun]|uniref:Uncharacterized protein n=1 Tax=Thelephora ganbajun TaxID=370292 RepID=A0ACB6ZJS2_THEGA|nr:hypothetical protein BDM02DRAFT_3113063 [Thelephora ganbajun]
MPPLPYQPREIVRIPASVNRALYDFFYNNSHLSANSEITGSNQANTQAPDPLSSPSREQSKGGPERPGVVLDASHDYATVAMFTTLQGKGLSEVKGVLRPIIAAILPVNHKLDAAAPGWLHTLAVHPTWRVPEVAQHSLCLCLKHRVSIDELKPWCLKDESAMAGEKFRMCRGDFRLLQQLCERNERLRGLFTSEIGWLFEELGMNDFVRRNV